MYGGPEIAVELDVAARNWSSVEQSLKGNQPGYFRFREDGWQFNLDTHASRMTSGVWLLTATLPDGSEHSAWIQIRE